MKKIYPLFALLFSIVASGQNDLCTNATLLTPGPSCVGTTGSFAGSGIESASGCSGNSGQDVWFYFTATQETLRVAVSTNDGLNPGIEILEGSCAGTSFGCVNTNSGGFGEVITSQNFTVGQTYYVRVFNAGNNVSSSTFSICVREYPRPANDFCANATALMPAASCNVTIGTLSGSEMETADTCTGNSLQDVWFSFVATEETMRVTVTTNDSLNPGLEVFEGDCAATPMTCVNTNSGGFGEVFFSQNFTIGQTYYVRVFHASAGISMSTFSICIQQYPRPANDFCVNATPLQTGVTCSSTLGTLSGSEMENPTTCSGNSIQDAWFSFTAPQETMLVVVSTNDALNPGFEIFEGSCDGTSFACVNTNSGGFGESYLNSTFTIGQTYYVRVFHASSGLSTSTFTICAQSYPRPSNDFCSNARTLYPGTTCNGITGTFAGAEMESGATCTGNSLQDVWYSFTATIGTYAISVDPTGNSNVAFQVLDACGGTSLLCVNGSGGGVTEFSQVSNLIVGNTYFVRVFNAAANLSTDTFSICVYGAVQNSCTPSVSITSDTASGCPGAAFTFTANPEFGGSSPSYQWYVNGQPAGTNSSVFISNMLVNGDHVSVSMTSNAACSTTQAPVSSSAVGITIYALPVVEFEYANGTLQATPGYASYVWTFDGGTVPNVSGPEIEATQQGIYAVTVTDVNGCIVTASFQLLSTDTQILESVQVFPNPTSGEITFSWPGSASVSVRIFDLVGKEFLQASSAGRLTIDSSQWPSGCYVAKVTNAEGITKVVKVIRR